MPPHSIRAFASELWESQKTRTEQPIARLNSNFYFYWTYLNNLYFSELEQELERFDCYPKFNCKDGNLYMEDDGTTNPDEKGKVLYFKLLDDAVPLVFGDHNAFDPWCDA